jgi:hypothetical protein
MYQAVATCAMDGKWAKDANGSIMCACIARNAMSMTGGTGGTGMPVTTPPKPVCGNGKVEAPEQCETSNLNNATCTSLMMGVGVLSCSKTCMYDMSMCGKAHGGMGGSGDEGMGGTGG